MNLFRILALLSPLVVGLTVPFLISRYRQKDHDGQTPAVAVTVFYGAVVCLLFLFAAVYGESLARWIYLSLYLLAFTLLAASAMGFLLFFRVGPNVAQIVVSVAVVLMMGTVFYISPILESAGNKSTWCSLAVYLNPWVIIGDSILERDVLHGGFIYRFSKIREYFYVSPSWGGMAVNYLVISAFLWMPHLIGWVWRWTGRAAVAKS